MLSFTDETTGFEGRNSERINFRTKAPIKVAIQRAAALSGVDTSTFTMSAALREAEKVIEVHERTRLASVDQEAFFSALEAKPDLNDALINATERYRSRVASK